MTKIKQKLSKIKNKKLIVLVSLIVIALAAVGYYSYVKITLYNDATNLTWTSQTRDLVVKAIQNLETPAPVDAKTGDIYFPQAKLYLPTANSSFDQRLIYNFYQDDQKGDHLSISNDVILNALIARTYTARNLDEFFDRIPHLQACSRGITVSYKQLTKDEIDGSLRQSVRLNNGKTIYLYSENACPELDDTVTTLKKLQAYK